MDLEDKTPQNENRNPVAEISFLSLEPESGLEGYLAESGDVGSVDTSPSEEEPSVVRNQSEEGGGEENMSQSYHEIFDTQAYILSHLTAAKKQDQDESGSEATQMDNDHGKKVEAISGPETEKETETEDASPVKSPDSSDDRVSSENSGNTETGQPFIPQGDVYLEEGRLVSDEDSQMSRDYLTNKLVADSLIWQQNYKSAAGESPVSPEEPLRPPQRNETCVMRYQEPKSVSMMSDPVLLATLEREARRLASDVDTVVENLACILQSISALTVETVETYRDGVCKTCDSVDDNIKGMYRLIARWEELNKSMSPCYKLSTQIKEIRKVVDVFDASLANSGSKS